jgi:hypothetical protein
VNGRDLVSNLMFTAQHMPTRPVFERSAALLIVTVLIGSMILGGAAINRSGFWHDEIASIGFITDSAAWYPTAPEQMPAYYVVLRGWASVAGLSEVAGRWLSLLFGLLTLAVTYRLTASYVSRRVAALTLLVLGSSAFFVRYYREMRPYMLLALGCTLSMWFFLEWLNKRRYADAGLYLAVSVIAVYTHYFAGLVVAAQGIYFLFAAKPLVLLPKPKLQLNRSTWITLGLLAGIALSLTPYLAFYLSGLQYVTSGRYAIYALTASEALNSTVVALTNDSLAVFLILVLLAILARPRGLGMASLWAFLPVVTVLFIHAFVYKMLAGPRYLIFAWPAFAIVASMGIDALRNRATLVAVVVLVCVGVAQVYNDLPGQMPGALNNPPWREMFSTIGQRAQANSRVLVNMVDPTGLSSYRQPMFYYFNKYMPPNSPKPIELDFPPQPTSADLLELAKRTNEVWLIATDGVSNERGENARKTLREAGYAQCRTWEYPEQRTFLSYWGRVDGETFNFENGIRIVRRPLSSVKDRFSPGQTLEIALGAYTAAQLPIDYSLGVYLLDQTGRVVAQQDGPVANARTSTWTPDARFCDVRSLRLPEVPGKYTVLLAVYDAAAGTRVAAAPDSSADKLITLFTVTVE